MKKWLAEYEKLDGKMYASFIHALDWEHAQMICDKQNLGETVIGLHILTISSFGMSDKKADAMCKAFSECEHCMDLS